MSETTTTPTTAPAVHDSTDVRREVARLRRALSHLWEATNAHTRDDRTYDRLRADRDTLDEALAELRDLRAPLAAVSAAAPVVIDPHSSHHQPVPGCAYCPQPVYATGANAAAAPDEREALSGEGLPERFRFSREVYGDVADDATRVLLAVTDGGHGIVPDDNLRWIAITAAQALAARPAPVVSGADDQAAAVKAVEQYPTLTVTAWNATPEQAEAIFEAAMDAAYAAAGDIALDGVATLVRRTVADTPAADDEGGQE